MELVQAAEMIKKTFQWLVHWCKLQETLNNDIKNLKRHKQQVRKYQPKQKHTRHCNWSGILRFSQFIIVKLPKPSPWRPQRLTAAVWERWSVNQGFYLQYFTDNNLKTLITGRFIGGGRGRLIDVRLYKPECIKVTCTLTLHPTRLNYSG